MVSVVFVWGGPPPAAVDVASSKPSERCLPQSRTTASQTQRQQRRGSVALQRHDKARKTPASAAVARHPEPEQLP
jgi:hypothetical protein